MGKRIFWVGVICLVLTGCASAPIPRQIQNSFPIDRPFDKIWEAVIETFAELNLPIINMEKASGLITTDWIKQDDLEASDCGRIGMLSLEMSRRMKFNVFVKKIADASEIKVNTMFEILVKTVGIDPIEISSCYSTGKLEKEIYDLVKAKIQ